MRLRKLFLLGVTLTLFTACTIKTFYNQLDWLLADHIESYVELTNEQHKLLYQRLDKFFLWHKSTQLPLYVDWLQDFKLDIQNRASAEAIELNFEQFKHFLRSLRERGAAEALLLLTPLSKSQRAELYQGMENKNQEFANKFINLSRAEQLEQYIERTEDRLEEWLGSLTDQQKELVQKNAQQIKPVASYVLQSRRNWQQEFKTILESEQTAKQRKAAIYDLFVNVVKRRSDAYKAFSLHNQKLFARLVADVARIMTPGQLGYLSDKVDNYSRHFMELAREAKRESTMQ